MAWSDDMRCLHCDGKLPLYQKITNGQFCSASHRRAYWKEQERLAVERLHQTHDTLRAYHPPAALEAALGFSAAEPKAAAPHPVSPATEAIARSASNTDRVKSPGFVPSRRPELQPLSANHPIALEPEPTAWAVSAPPVPRRAIERSWNEIAMAGRVAIRVDMRLADGAAFASPVAVMPAAVMAGELASVTAPAPVMTRLSLAAAPQTPEFEAVLLQPPPAEQPAIAEQLSPVEEQPAEEPRALEAEPRMIPPSETLWALPRISARDIEHGEHVRMSSALAALEAISNPPAVNRNVELDAPALSTAGVQALALRAAAGAFGQPADHLQAIDLRTEPGFPAVPLATPSSQPSPRRAQSSRYAVRQQRPLATLAGEVEPHLFEPRLEPGLASAHLPLGLAAAVAAPNAAPALPLTWEATPRAPGAAPIAASAVFSAPQLQGMKPMQPVLRVDPLEGNPEPPPKRNLLWMQRSTQDKRGDAQDNHIWAHAVDFWEHAPRDLKLLAVAIPVLLALALHPSLPKVRVTAPAATGQIETGVGRSLRAQFINVRQSVADRAGVSLNEDFRSGLDEWQARGDRATAWSFDATGFVRPASLSLYRPSMGLADYEMQFLGLIDKKALSWVVRARDFDNYYVMKLVVLKSGPLPALGITRYAVIDGKAQNRVDTPAPIEARPDMLYRVSLDVHGDTYLLALQGKIVDSWSEPRLARGGVGFFAPHGEESRLRWVQVTHQYDMLGRLCAYLAPYNIQNTNGSW
jgi:hypothetical protein